MQVALPPLRAVATMAPCFDHSRSSQRSPDPRVPERGNLKSLAMNAAFNQGMGSKLERRASSLLKTGLGAHRWRTRA